jgi:hypothetical protein
LGIGGASRRRATRPASDLPMRPVALRPIAPALAAGALLALAACASGPPPADQVTVTPTRTRIDTPTGSYDLRTTVEDRGEAITLKVAPDVAWSKIAAVYAELGLPVNTYVDASRQIGAKGVRVRRQLSKIRLSQLVQCGADLTGEDKANSYEITLDVATAVGGTPDGQTQIVTMLTANGRAMATSSDPVRCTSTGQLEKRIANALLVKAGTAG